jgi:tripartite-type tricarboxylate transporter receptor subunit TctC
VASGKIKVLAVTGASRDPFMPDLPTLAELGMPDATIGIMYGIVGPAGMPRDVTDKLRRDIVDVLNSPEARQKFQAAGFQPSPLAGDEFEKFVMTEYRTMTGVAEAEKIVVDD